MVREWQTPKVGWGIWIRPTSVLGLRPRISSRSPFPMLSLVAWPCLPSASWRMLRFHNGTSDYAWTSDYGTSEDSTSLTDLQNHRGNRRQTRFRCGLPWGFERSATELLFPQNPIRLQRHTQSIAVRVDSDRVRRGGTTRRHNGTEGVPARDTHLGTHSGHFLAQGGMPW